MNTPGLFTRLELAAEKYTPDPFVFAVAVVCLVVLLLVARERYEPVVFPPGPNEERLTAQVHVAE